MKFFAVFFLLMTFSSSLWALPVDEKLTLRVIKTSDTRKTMLINRGAEDGLQEGDHAKFFLTVGVVARGVVVKVSPTRSVWSVYRLVNADYIRDDQVMNLKITPPVKITNDESRMLVDDDTPRVTTLGRGDPRDLGIPLADGAEDLTEQDKLFMAREDSSRMDFGEATDIRNKNMEVFGTVSFSSMTSSTVPDNNGVEYSSKEQSTGITIGGEYYFKNISEWYSNISLAGAFSIGQRSLQSHSGEEVSSNTTDFIGLLHLHILKKPFEIYTLIPYLQVGASMGSIKTQYTPGAENLNGQVAQGTGSSMSVMFGGGLKYYTPKGFGARVILEYFSRKDDFDVDYRDVIWSKTQSGPRFYTGISYRF